MEKRPLSAKRRYPQSAQTGASAPDPSRFVAPAADAIPWPCQQMLLFAPSDASSRAEPSWGWGWGRGGPAHGPADVPGGARSSSQADTALLEAACWGSEQEFRSSLSPNVLSVLPSCEQTERLLLTNRPRGVPKGAGSGKQEYKYICF